MSDETNPSPAEITAEPSRPAELEALLARLDELERRLASFESGGTAAPPAARLAALEGRTSALLGAALRTESEIHRVETGLSGFAATATTHLAGLQKGFDRLTAPAGETLAAETARRLDAAVDALRGLTLRVRDLEAELGRLAAFLADERLPPEAP
jgi:hypothetical protein